MKNPDVRPEKVLKVIENVTDGFVILVVVLYGTWTIGGGDDEILELFLWLFGGMVLVLLTRRWRVVAWFFRIPFVFLIGLLWYRIFAQGVSF